MNPGTSMNVTSGMLKASQNRTNRAAFTEALMSSTPARKSGWFANDTHRPAPQCGACPTMMFRA